MLFIRKSHILMCIAVLAAVVTCLPGQARAAIPESERQALIDLHSSTDGANWTNTTGWLGDPGTECSWYGVTCDAGETHVTEIGLAANQLRGTIPPGIGALTSLTRLDLNTNQLTGTIPREITSLSSLTGLNLSYNCLHTGDASVRDFLNAKESDWEATQTISPGNLTAGTPQPIRFL